MAAVLARIALALTFLLYAAAVPSIATAQATNPAATAEEREAERAAALAAVMKARRIGPVRADVFEQAGIDLSYEEAFVPAAETVRYLRAWGNCERPNVVGMVQALGGPPSSWIVVEFVRSGYIRDDAAPNLNADRLLKETRAVLEECNAELRARGETTIEILRWLAHPEYDDSFNRVGFAAVLRESGAEPDSDPYIWASIASLGREGYVVFHLVTDDENAENDARQLRHVVSSLRYVIGKQYDEFDPATDRVSEHGLEAVVSGAANR